MNFQENDNTLIYTSPDNNEFVFLIPRHTANYEMETIEILYIVKTEDNYNFYHGGVIKIYISFCKKYMICNEATDDESVYCLLNNLIGKQVDKLPIDLLNDGRIRVYNVPLTKITRIEKKLFNKIFPNHCDDNKYSETYLLDMEELKRTNFVMFYERCNIQPNYFKLYGYFTPNNLSIWVYTTVNSILEIEIEGPTMTFCNQRFRTAMIEGATLTTKKWQHEDILTNTKEVHFKLASKNICENQLLFVNTIFELKGMCENHFEKVVYFKNVPAKLLIGRTNVFFDIGEFNNNFVETYLQNNNLFEFNIDDNSQRAFNNSLVAYLKK